MSIFAPSQITEDPDAATLESMKSANVRLYKRGEVTEDLRRERALTIATRYGKSHHEIAGDAREYKGAQVNLANYNWTGSNASADSEQQHAMAPMRARARDLEQNNAYAERFLSELEANVLGPEGMNLQMQIQEWDPTLPGDPDPKTGIPKKGGMVPDEGANDKIESAWYEWKKAGVCDVSGELSYHEIERLMLRSTARDGHALCRIVRFWKGNRFGIALQPIESDALDTNYNVTLPNGNIVVMGVEMDVWRKRVAYHILTKHPGDYFTPTRPNNDRRERVPADEIIHLRFLRRVGQTVGVSWFAPVMDLLEMLRGYEEAELISARSEACKGGYFYNDMTGEAGFSGTVADPSGIKKKMVPGQQEILPYGWKYQANNPTHPNGNYSNYRVGVLRGVASGLGCSSNVLANDLTGVSYSSLRGGLLDEREIYKMLQSWFISRFELQVFNAWYESTMINRAINLPISKFDKFNAPYFQGRRWAWVDPKKDIEAAKLAIEAGFSSHREIVAENGKYILDVAREQKADRALSDRFGLNWFPQPEGDIQLLPVAGNEETDATTETATEAVAKDGGAAVADTALNGIQVQALLEVLGKITSGELPKTTAKAIIQAAFPLMDVAVIDTMLKDIKEGSQPIQPAQPPPLPNAPKPVTPDAE